MGASGRHVWFHMAPEKGQLDVKRVHTARELADLFLKWVGECPSCPTCFYDGDALTSTIAACVDTLNA